MTKSCITCRHCRVPKVSYLDTSFSECRAPQNMVVRKVSTEGNELVDPEWTASGDEPSEPHHTYCKTLRLPAPTMFWIRIGPPHCGPEADWWEPRV